VLADMQAKAALEHYKEGLLAKGKYKPRGPAEGFGAATPAAGTTSVPSQVGPQGQKPDVQTLQGFTDQMVRLIQQCVSIGTTLNNNLTAVLRTA
jgi:hypothetical protein